MAIRSITRNISSCYETQQVGKVLNRKRFNANKQPSSEKIAVGVAFTLMLCYELNSQSLARWLLIDQTLLWWFEITGITLTSMYVLCEVGSFFANYIFSSSIDITAEEKKLLGVTENEPGFKLSPVKKEEPCAVRIRFSPAVYNSKSFINRSFSPTCSSPAIISSTPSLDDSVHSSTMYSVGSKSFNDSFTFPLGTSFDGSQQPRRVSPSRNLLNREESFITSQRVLDTFLSEQAAKDRVDQMTQGDTHVNLAPSFWNFNRSVMDYLPILRKFQYQTASRSTQSTKSSHLDGDTESQSECTAEKVWLSARVRPSDVDVWIENLRYWIGQTIVQRLANEIEKVNNELRKVGCEDMQVGEVTVSTLKNLTFTKGQFVPTLTNIIPYLEVTTNQEYLIQRIKVLAQDGCMAEFCWNGGGSHKGRAWEDHLPTDSAIVMHLFCTYMNARIPANPKYPDGKVFTCQHFMAAPEKPNFAQKKDYLCIYQTKVNPTNFKVVIGDKIYDVLKGRSNLFQAILLFIYHIKEHENGMLGHVSIGPSGINLLWVLTQKYR